MRTLEPDEPDFLNFSKYFYQGAVGRPFWADSVPGAGTSQTCSGLRDPASFPTLSAKVGWGLTAGFQVPPAGLSGGEDGSSGSYGSS